MYLLNKERIPNTERDELDNFFDSIKATVRKFSPTDIHLVKNKIFFMVSDIESKYILPKDNQINTQQFPTYSQHSNIQPQVQSQYHQFENQPSLHSATSSSPPSSACVSTQSSTSSYYENFSPTNYD